jgi:hypothetical protein
MDIYECIALVEQQHEDRFRYFGFNGVEYRALMQVVRARARDEAGTTFGEIMRRVLEKLEAVS